MQLKNIAIPAALLLSACAESALTAPAFDSDGRVVGIIELVEGPALQRPGNTPHTVLAAPDTVTANVPFAATITTVGLSGCWHAAGAGVRADARRAVVTPYDRVVTHVEGQPVPCTGALVDLPRTVNLVFTQRGEATLRVEGRRVFENNVANASLLAVEKRIWVR